MRFWTFIAITALVPFTSAQGGFSQGFDPSDVDPPVRSQWCSAQMNTYTLLCNGTIILDSYVGVFTGTIPTFMCEFVISTCVSEAAGNQAEEENCSALETCGSINPTGFVLPSSTSNGETHSARVLNTGSVSSATTSTTSSSSGTGSTDSTSPSAGSLPRLTNPSIAASSSPSASVPSGGNGISNTDGLSTAAKVGIAIRTVVGVFGLVLGGYLLGRRRKDHLNTHPGMAELSHNGIHEILQLETKERPGELEGRELPDERVHEIG